MSQDQQPESNAIRIVRFTGAKSKARFFPDHMDGNVAHVEVLPQEEPGVGRIRFIGENGQPLGNGAVVCVPLADGASDADVRKAVKKA